MVTKTPTKNEKNRVYPLYSLSEKGEDFLTDFGLKSKFEEHIQKLRSN